MKSRSPSSREHARVGLGLGRRAAGALELGVELAELLAHLRERAVEVGPVEPDGGRAALHLARVEQPGQRLGHVVEDARAALLLGLDRLPALAHPAGRVGHRVAEDVRMAADELRVHGAGDRLEVAVPLLLEQQREEVRLEEKVAELVEQLRRVAGVRGVGDLVGLLDRVRHDRARRLLPVPGAVAAQALRQLLQVDERLGERPSPACGTRTLSRWSSPSWSSVAASGGANPVAYVDLLGEVRSWCRPSTW